MNQGIAITESYLSGYAWASNFGWIYFGNGSPANGYSYANNASADVGVNHDGAGNLYGYAWSANVGWIHFGTEGSVDTNRPRFDLQSGDFTGYAWSGNLGWINLGGGLLTTSRMDCPDTDSDGMADSWEMKYFGNLTTATDKSDYDGDGEIDPREYLSATDPTDPDQRFQIVDYAFGLGSGKYSLVFTSSVTRLYRIYHNDDLETRWTLASLGLFAPDTGGITSKTYTGPISDMLFFRVEAVKPLQP
ncbi:hypothetical protein [Coraliomargarita sinensis]|uniref:hypothetical protein n=1 Tax=Coraliomargarita sinensis TaxID=2174842 RepID=UPI0011B859DF|nr:hypothetical protein [Coraliomargarita sinensis]